MTKLSGTSPAVDIDALLQDTYLLVVELQQKAATKDGAELWNHCAAQVERCRKSLNDAGVSQRTIALICYAQCALIDETVMRHATAQSHAIWASKPLQAQFFNRHQAGEQLYEDMREALARSAPDRLALTCYHRVLMLGFLGRYRDEGAPEREQLLTALNEHVEPLTGAGSAPVLVRGGGGSWHHWLGQPWLHLAGAAIVLAAVWLMLHRVLVDAVAVSLSGQV